MHLKITWDDYVKVHSEYISTNNLTEEEIQQTNKWIEAHDKEYKNPIDYEELIRWKVFSMN
ncbi:MAG: hypothetical protein VB095_01485 [Anaerovorax sp.]|nr:hypothetical protein [Anaerovorax sp.]